MSKVFVWALWGFLMIIGLILLLPYTLLVSIINILESIINIIDKWTEELELGILDNYKDKEEKNGRNA